MLDDGSFFLILQFVRGATLHDVIRRGPVPALRAARIARQLASALDACHSMGIIHRDLKPRNIMVEEDRDDFVKLIDFGFAKVPMDRIATIERRGSLKDLKVTAMGTIFGTPSYMAPEIALGMDAVDHRSDLYALGVIFYEMLAGAHPFDSKNPSDLIIMHRTVVPPSIAERTGVDVPPALEAIAMRLLTKDPTLRYPSAAALVEAIDEATPGSLAPRTPHPSRPLLSPQSSPPQASSQPSPPQPSSQP
jgi:eukaryotic-like serine/threonine-protein kinase